MRHKQWSAYAKAVPQFGSTETASFEHPNPRQDLIDGAMLDVDTKEKQQVVSTTSYMIRFRHY
jgi:hypothetical protein